MQDLTVLSYLPYCSLTPRHAEAGDVTYFQNLSTTIRQAEEDKELSLSDIYNVCGCGEHISSFHTPPDLTQSPYSWLCELRQTAMQLPSESNSAAEMLQSKL